MSPGMEGHREDTEFLNLTNAEDPPRPWRAVLLSWGALAGPVCS